MCATPLCFVRVAKLTSSPFNRHKSLLEGAELAEVGVGGVVCDT